MSKQSYQGRDPRYIAYHEAGHAVVNLVIGYKVTKATIRPRYSLLGRVNFDGRVSDDKVDEAIAKIKSNLAGPLAEQLINPEQFDNLILNGSRGDWQRVRRAAQQIANGMIDRLIRDTHALVQEHRSAIERIAAALLEHETLTGKEIEGLFDEVVS